MLDEIYDLFIDLDATEDQLDFPVVYTNARAGIATRELDEHRHDLRPLFDLIVDALPGPAGRSRGRRTQFQCNNLDYNDYVGRLAIGRVKTGALAVGGQYTRSAAPTARQRPVKITQLYAWHGLEAHRGPVAPRRRHRRHRRHRGDQHRRHDRRPREPDAAARRSASTSRPSP